MKSMCPEILREMWVTTMNANANRCVTQGGIFTTCRGANGKNIPGILSKEWDWSNNLIHQILDKKFKNNGK
jgi:hypothetical protein